MTSGILSTSGMLAFALCPNASVSLCATTHSMEPILTIEEIELFKAADLWATKECERQGLAADEEAKRGIRGEEIIKGIRFLIMDEKDFASVVLGSEILTKEEIVSVLKLRNLVPNPSKEFSKTKRSGSESNIQRCCRFNSFLNRRLQYINPLRDDNIIVFSVDRDINER